MFFTASVIVLIGIVGGIVLFLQQRMIIVPEDHIAVTVDKNDFVKRSLAAGKHILRPFERVSFTLAIKPRLVTGQAAAVVTGDGILVNINWSGIFALDPTLITDKVSRRLRGLPGADGAIARKTDIELRRLIGDCTVQELFRPTTRQRIEQELRQTLAERLKVTGIVLSGFNLQVIELPQEVVGALNKAKAIEALDGAIRHLDPTTREVVRGAYQLDEILHWDAYLPVPSRLGMKRIGNG